MHIQFGRVALGVGVFGHVLIRNVLRRLSWQQLGARARVEMRVHVTPQAKINKYATQVLQVAAWYIQYTDAEVMNMVTILRPMYVAQLHGAPGVAKTCYMPNVTATKPSFEGRPSSSKRHSQEVTSPTLPDYS